MGCIESYADYMMGHVTTTYNDMQMLGVEFLRNIYAAAGLSIRPKTKVNRIDMIKEMIRSLGMNSEQVLSRGIKSASEDLCRFIGTADC